VRRYRKKWGFFKAKGQAHTIDTIGPHIEVVHERFPTQGVRATKAVLRQEYELHVSTKLVARYNRIFEPAAVAARRRHAYTRTVYITIAVGETWGADQHDKWLRFELFLHVCVDVYSGKVLWLKIWWTNKNPRLIASYFLDTVQHHGFMPRLTQSDRGSENHGLANAETELRHIMRPALGDTLQHKWRAKNRNIKPEIFWSLLRHGWTPGFEQTLQYGLTVGLYVPRILWERSLFHFLFVPWLQRELDAFAHRVNHERRRPDKHVTRPRDEPEFIFNNPERYGSNNLHLPVTEEAIDEVRNLYAPPQHPVFQLVEPSYGRLLTDCYEEIGSPEMNLRTCWDVY
ncbi:hypothetical protein SISNIDRAFT_393871, partial [Sistotremastrum niveocremeum HHB9708]